MDTLVLGTRSGQGEEQHRNGFHDEHDNIVHSLIIDGV
jgi:hypothetical protein